MPKYTTIRYKNYMKSLADMLTPDTGNNRYLNSLIGSMTRLDTNEEHINGLEDTNELLYIWSELTKSIADNASKKDVPEDQIQQWCQRDENIVKNVTAKLRTQCNEFMQSHPKYKDDYDKVNYRKFEYILSLLDAYDSAQNELEKMVDEPNVDSVINRIADEKKAYERLQAEMPGKMKAFRDFASENLVEDDLPDELKELYKDDISPEFILAHDNPGESISTEIASLEDEIRDIEEKCNTAKRDADFAMDGGQKSLEAQFRMDLAPFENEYQEALKDIESRRREAEKGLVVEIPEETVRKNIEAAGAYNDNRFDAVSIEYRNAGSPAGPEDSDRLGWTRQEISNTDEYFDAMLNTLAKSEREIDGMAETLAEGYETYSNKVADLQGQLKNKYDGFVQLDRAVFDFNEAHKKADKQSDAYREKYMEIIKSHKLGDPVYSELVASYESAENEYKELQSQMDDFSVKAFMETDLKGLEEYGITLPQQETKEQDKKLKEELTKMDAPLHGKVYGQSAIGKSLFKSIGDLEQNIKKYKTFYNANGSFDLPESTKEQFRELTSAVNGLKGLKGLGKTEDAINLGKVFKNYDVLIQVQKALNNYPNKDAQEIGVQFGKLKEELNKIQENPAYSALKKGQNFFNKYDEDTRRAEEERKTAITQKLGEMEDAINKNRDASKALYEKLLKYPEEALKETFRIKKDLSDNEIIVEGFEKRIAQNKLDKEYMGASREYINSQRDMKKFSAKSSVAKEELENIQKDAEKIDKDFTDKKNELEGRKDYNLDLLKDEYEEKVQKINKDRERIKPLGEKLERMKLLQSEVSKLFKFKNLLVGKATELGSAQANLKSTQDRIKNNIASQRNLMSEKISTQITATIAKLKGTGKIGFNSKEYNNMVTALNSYQNGECRLDSKNAFVEYAKAARNMVQTYIDKKNADGKAVRTTANGQKRMDCAYTLIRLFDQMERRLGAFDAETEKINNLMPEKPVVTPDEAQIIGGGTGMTFSVNKVEHQAQKPLSKELFGVRNHFKPLTSYASDINKTLGDILKEGIDGLAQKNVNGFTRGVAAMTVAAAIKGKDIKNISENQLSSLVDKFAKTEAVKKLASDLTTKKDAVEDAQKKMSDPEFAKSIGTELKEIESGSLNKNEPEFVAAK